MSTANKVVFIKDAGACIASKNILEGKGQLKWLLREKPLNDVDNGWRFFSDIDDNSFINNSDNLVICDFNSIVNIEPSILGIYLFPIGSDLQLVVEDKKIVFYDNLTGSKVELLYS